ncbi:MAG: hypothetical protein PGN16_03820 [Sphingomonas phyllosphaerae]|uniref:hypothetical protein n=1 Tax=Sphingomonas phyllosphaerae TaxID=257003 RepID=UPI002FFA6BD7
MRPDLELRDFLAAAALNETPDAMWATSVLLAAASVVLGNAIGDREAGEAILGTVREAVSKARH